MNHNGRSLSRLSRAKRTGIAGLCVLAFLCSCHGSKMETPTQVTGPVHEVSAEVAREEVAREIVRFCSLCHALPKPESFPKAAWYDEVKAGFEFYRTSGRHDMTPPAVQTTVDYFRSRAPVKLDAPAKPIASGTERRRFRSDSSKWPQFASRSEPPAI